MVHACISALSSRFSLKEPSDLTYFLGVEATRTSAGLHLMQRKYIIDLLTKTKMLDAKPVATPMPISPKLTITSGQAMDDPREFRMILGSLQYLSFTRPDIAYSVNKLSQFMHRPTDEHWQAVKRVLRYLAGTLSLMESSSVVIHLCLSTPTRTLIGQGIPTTSFQQTRSFSTLEQHQ